MGIFVDLGAAFLGEPDISLSAEGGTFSNNTLFKSELQKEEDKVQADIQENKMPQRLLKLWPILQIGVKFGLGG